MAMSNEIKERIFAAADSLHAGSETGEYPSVEAVRQESRAGMNNVVEGMKEWRQNQRKQVQAVREPLPVELHRVVQSLGESLWETAQQLANESLDAAKISFEMEKTDLIQLSAEQSEAYEAQALSLGKAESRIAELDSELETARADIEEARAMVTETQQAVHLAEQRAEEVERRAGELRAELDHAHIEANAAATAAKSAADNLRADADRVRIERDKAQQRQELVEAESTKLAAKLAEANAKTAKAEAAADNHSQQFYRATEENHKAGEKLESARTEVAKAREEAATLRGQLEATMTQNANLMAALKPAPAVKPGKSPKTDN